MDIIKATTASILGGLTYLLGGWDIPLEVLCTIIFFDILIPPFNFVLN